MKTSKWTSLRSCGCCGHDRAVAAGRAQSVGLLRCAACGTVRFEAVVPPGDVYDDGYHVGETAFGWDYLTAGARGYEAAMANQRLDFLARFRRPGRLVDVGGGLGYFAAAAARRGWAAELLEPVPAAIEYARTTLGLTAHLGGAELLADLDRKFDVVAFVHCIEHIPAARDTLAAARGVIAPSGLLFVEVPNHGSLARRWQGERWLGWQAGEHVYVFTKRTLLGLLARAGFEPIAVRTYVPGWDGLDPDGYAHMLGLRVPLTVAISLKRRLRRRGPRANGQGRNGRPPAIAERSGRTRAIYSRGFAAATRLEQALGLGTNLQVLARPAGRSW